MMGIEPIIVDNNNYLIIDIMQAIPFQFDAHKTIIVYFMSDINIMHVRRTL